MIRPLPPLRNVQRWLATLVRQNRVVRVGGSRSVRYKLAEADASMAQGVLSPVGQALQVLISQPLASRPTADYRRVALDSYRPNQTYHLPEETRQRLGAPAARLAPGGATTLSPAVSLGEQSAVAACASDAGASDTTIADLAWRVGYFPRYLLKTLQDHFDRHGDELHEELKHVRNVLDAVLGSLRFVEKAAVQSRQIEAMAQVHRLLRSNTPAPSDPNQMALF